jgi:hypothetical protein
VFVSEIILISLMVYKQSSYVASNVQMKNNQNLKRSTNRKFEQSQFSMFLGLYCTDQRSTRNVNNSLVTAI